MSVITECPQAALYFRQGSSDKIYQIAIEPSGPGFTVNFAYGRRGSTLQTGTKTPSPVGYDEAVVIYDRLIREKTAKGYSPAEIGTPYQQTAKAERTTGVLPQLLNPIDEAEAEMLISDPAWLMQEKVDGKRVLIRRTGDTVIGINRTGLVIALPQLVVQCALKIPTMQFIIDGECIGDTFIVFDLLEKACMNLRTEPYRKRLDALYRTPVIGSTQPIQFIRTATKTNEKRTMLAELRRLNKEGVVFKRIEAPYTAGRPNSGGDQLKLKFVSTASCIVARTNGSKRSIKLELISDNARVSVGNVTIPPNQTIPSAGQVAEVRYLYAHPGGSLFQPVYLGLRDDLCAAECKVTQLKFKPEDGEA